MITVNAKELKKAIKAIKMSKIVRPKSRMPILSYIRIASRGGELELLGSNLEQTILTRIPCSNSGDDIETTINLSQLDVCLRQINCDEINLQCLTDTRFSLNNLEIESVKVDEFPNVLFISNCEEEISITHSFLSELKIVFGATDKSIRENLMGIYFDSEHSAIVATDGHRLSKLPYKFKGECSKKIIPNAFFTALFALNDTGNLYLESDQVLFKSGNCSIYSKYVDGNFPSWEGVIPNNFATDIKGINVDKFKSNIDACCQLLKHEKCPAVKLTFSADNTIEFLAKNSAGSKYSASMNGLTKSRDLTIGVNPFYFSEYVKNIKNNFSLCTSGSLDIITFLNETTDCEYFVMPLKLDY